MNQLSLRNRSEQRLLLVDGYAVIYRSFYAIRSLSNSKGHSTNAVYGFLKSLRKMLTETNPSHAAVVMDVGKPRAKLEQLPTYKITRKPMPDDLRSQIEPIRQLVIASGLHLLGVEGVEADDIIATLATQGKRNSIPVVIVTSDKDLMQLVDDHVHVLNPANPDQLMDAEAVRERFGVSPKQIPDFLTLTGDTVDNVPGVPGIGERTAQALLQQFGSLDALMKSVDTIDRPRIADSIRAHREQVEFVRSFVTLDCNLQLPWNADSLSRRPPDYNRLQELLNELEFKSLAREIAGEAARVSNPQLDFSTD